MKLLRYSLLTAVLLAGAGYQQQAKAQGAVIDVLGSGVDDADKLLNAYFRPFGESFAIGLGQNWYNSAAPLKLLRFNVQVGASVVMIPTEKQTFNPTALGMNNLRPLGNNASTIFGPTGDGPGYELSTQDPTNPANRLVIDTLNGLTQGLGLNFMAAPFAQVNLGLIKGTEVSVRYVPTLDLSSLGGGVNGKFGMWGVGVKHDIKQWIPVVNKLPFSFSGYFNYTKLNFELGVSLPGPESKTYQSYAPGNTVGFDYVGGGAGNYSNQAIAMDATSMGYGIILSKKLLMFTPYVSAGMQRATFSLRTEGDYAILSGLKVNDVTEPQPGAFREQYRVFNEPINISPDAINAFRYSVGLRVKLLIFGIHAEYFGVGGFTGVNAGLSLGF
jgi:hypothetical protein